MSDQIVTLLTQLHLDNMQITLSPLMISVLGTFLQVHWPAISCIFSGSLSLRSWLLLYMLLVMECSCLLAGALAGIPFGVDRQFIAEELGFFGGVCPNSMDAVSDRDFVIETLFFCSLHLVHLSRWAEDLIIYSSGAFKYVQCSDAYATGQALQPLSVCLQAFICKWSIDGHLGIDGQFRH